MTSREGGPPAEDDHGCWRAEAERLAVENAGRLAVENAGLGRENAAQRVRTAGLEGQVAALTEKVATLTTLVFGGSTEAGHGHACRRGGPGGCGDRAPPRPAAGFAGE